MRRDYLIAGGVYLAFGAYCYWKWKPLGTISAISVVTWPYQLATGAPAPWTIAATMTVPPASTTPPAS
jgi:hypothetical protein